MVEGEEGGVGFVVYRYLLSPHAILILSPCAIVCEGNDWRTKRVIYVLVAFVVFFVGASPVCQMIGPTLAFVPKRGHEAKASTYC